MWILLGLFPLLLWLLPGCLMVATIARLKGYNGSKLGWFQYD